MILIAEDEAKLAAVVADYLTQEQFRTKIVSDGRRVAALVKELKPDLLLLDLMLPNRGGLEICKEIRTFSQLPILMITARTEVVDRLSGFNSGADDYICKPFSPSEVIARIRAVLRRTQGAPVATPGLAIDELAFKATLDDRQLNLTPSEFKLLNILASAPQRIFSREQIIDALYTDGREIVDRTIDSHIRNLRRKLAEVRPGSEWIESVYGVGYRLLSG
ncbi:MAG TPA: response regulator [Steroidobacteraceae bacterium]|nr:response regulator [Steroidobacteraceae bacterium]